MAGFVFNTCELESIEDEVVEEEKTEHSIRVKNELSLTLNNVKVGSVEYGDVDAGEITDYKVVEEGKNSVGGYSDNGGTLEGTVTVSGSGVHKYTLTIQTNGDLDISEDN